MNYNKYKLKSNVFLSEIGADYLPIVRFYQLIKFPDILHFITTRQGGFSEKPFHSFNLASHVGDREEHVFRNREQLAAALCIPAKNFIFAQQEHGTNILITNFKKDVIDNNNFTKSDKVGDAFLTDDKGICLLIFVADCVPVLFFDYKKRVIGLAHAGWKGTIGLISQKTVQLMQSHYGCSVQDIICGLGPSIGPCCYEVGEEVLDKARDSFSDDLNHLIHHEPSKNQYFFDLWQANKVQLLKCGIPEENIALANICTSCHSDLFFSNRKEKGYTGRFAAGIMLRR